MMGVTSDWLLPRAHGASWRGAGVAGRPPARRVCSRLGAGSPSSTGPASAHTAELRRRPAPAWSSPTTPPAGLLDGGRRGGGLAGLRAAPPAGAAAALGAGLDGLQRAGAGLAAARPGRAAVAGRDRHQRQDHHRRRCSPRSCGPPGCVPPRWATSASRWSTPPRRTGYDVLAVELSSFQLHWSHDAGARRPGRCSTWPTTTSTGTAASTRTPGPRPRSGAGGRRRRRGGQPRRPAGRARCWPRVPGPRGRLHARRAAARGRSAWSTACWSTADRATAPVRSDRRRRASGPAGAHNVANALAAAALARGARRAGRGGRGRAGRVHARAAPQRATWPPSDGVAYVDDSKATNPHAACASLTAYPRIVWVAGGQLKGVDVDDLVAAVADRLAGAVLLGVDRAEIAAALARHAPRVPVVDVARTDDGAMARGRRRGRPARRARATPCCSPRPPRRWTCSPATPTAATRSPRRSALEPAVTVAPCTSRRARRSPTRTPSRPAAPAAPAIDPFAALRGLLARPLASYYLLLASAGLLLVIGLAMVFSATSVEAYATNGNAFTSIEQAGASRRWSGWSRSGSCQRLPVRTFRAARPAADACVRAAGAAGPARRCWPAPR